MTKSLLLLAMVFAMGSACAQNQITAGNCLVGEVKETMADGSMIVQWSNAGCKDDALTAYTVAAAADIASTFVALEFGRDALYEANPLGFGGGFVFKLAGYLALKNTAPSPERTKWANRAEAVQWGLATNNLCLFSGAAMPLCQAVGLVAGMVILSNREPVQLDTAEASEGGAQ